MRMLVRYLVGPEDLTKFVDTGSRGVPFPLLRYLRTAKPVVVPIPVTLPCLHWDMQMLRDRCGENKVSVEPSR